MEGCLLMHYIVQPGDILHNIAMQYHTTVRHLMDINPRIRNPNRIYVGERIEVGNQWVGLNPWWGNEYQRGQEEYQRGQEEYLRGREEYRRGREKSLKHHGRLKD
jgi:LysM repeat protein